ncbi:hypothetical protein CANCADRAFT_26108 [Tortispora caseinolytica NRRL Y-17796]|uniref:AAA+ ATPase domain-containing protein n=1 Tax=Tortispora caseinolytica NRRL Y-17796 TaxID=767744 RepID=A0A1E4TH82_9ASCO|nr:hypothetical protein CANCADRAFT_26108 [Tortispora caseinolytica NRRL Y-17796]
MSKWKIDPKLISDIIICVGVGSSIYYSLSYLLSQIPSGGEVSAETKRKANSVLGKIQASRPDLDLVLDEYERQILAQITTADEISVGFSDIGGLDNIISDIQESILLPLARPDIFAGFSSLLQAPQGVLLYGPPGCGKTMLAKALAKESGATFFNIKISAILDKWYGQSNKLVAAIFSLARKLEPSIIFIDEIDSFLRERQSTDHEVTALLKSEFMTLWDGLDSSGRILVLGATNRPNDIDSAFLRRMPKRFPVSLPNASQRRHILQLTLHDTELAADFDIDTLVQQTDNFSPSEMKEACRDAVIHAMRQSLRSSSYKSLTTPVDSETPSSAESISIRPLQNSDFFANGSASSKPPATYMSQLQPDVE